MKLVEFTGAESGTVIYVNPAMINCVAACDANMRNQGLKGSVIVINNQSITVKETIDMVIARLQRPGKK